MTATDYVRIVRSFPPGLTGVEIQKRLALPYTKALQVAARAKYRITDGRQFSQRAVRKLIPEAVDWRQSNIAIARRFRVSRERVRAVRAALGLPFVESRGRKPNHEHRPKPNVDLLRT